MWKVRAVEKKEIVEADKQATDQVLASILELIPKSAIENAAAEDLRSAQPYFRSRINMLKTNPSEALSDFNSQVKEDPKNIEARKASIYSKIFTEKK